MDDVITAYFNNIKAMEQREIYPDELRIFDGTISKLLLWRRIK